MENFNKKYCAALYMDAISNLEPNNIEELPDYLSYEIYTQAAAAWKNECSHCVAILYVQLKNNCKIMKNMLILMVQAE